MNSDLAAATQEAAAAEAVKKELEDLANAEAEYNRLYKQFGYLTEDIEMVLHQIESLEREMTEDPSLDFTADIESLQA